MPRLFSRRKHKHRLDKTSSPGDEPLKAENEDAIDAGQAPKHQTNSAAKEELGVKVLYEPCDQTATIVDIVFVHGLTGSSSNTWSHENAKTYWPIDFLSKDVPNSRIISSGYDADVVNFRSPVSQNRIGSHARNLSGGLAHLRGRSDTENRKIIFVAHSLGGLVVQHCLWSSTTRAEAHLNQIAACTTGIIFLGTPHHGADLAAWAKFGTSIAKIVKRPNTNIVDVLRPESEMLGEIQNGFHTILRQRQGEDSIDVTCFFEELPFPVLGKIVETHSAILHGYESYSIHANHVDMTKFANPSDNGYESILGELQRFVKKLQRVGATIPFYTSNYPPKAAKPLFTVRFSRDATFIDRSEIFEKIDEQMNTQSRVTLSGIGGIGKSQIAIEYCYRFRELNPNAHIVWIYAGKRERLEQAYRDLARMLDLPGLDDPKIDTCALVFEWFCEPDNGQWLIILDNADDLDTFFAKPTQSDENAEPRRPFIDYLPECSRGCMLITTRDNRISKRLASKDNPIVVDFMSLEEGLGLFRSEFEEVNFLNLEGSEELIDALGCIPLAITQAAAFICQNNTTIADYLRLISTNDSDIQDLLSEDSGDLRRDSDCQHSVIRTWKLSFDLISKKKPLAAEMLSFMAVLDRQGISEDLLRNICDRNLDMITALGTLQAFSLISRKDGRAEYILHRLVQLATQKWLEIQGTKTNWQERALQVLTNEFPNSGKFESWEKCNSLYPHALKVLGYEYSNRESLLDYAFLSRRLGRFELHQGRYENASTKLFTAFDLDKDLLGVDHPDTLIAKTNLAAVYFAQGRLDEAEELLIEVLKARKRVLKANHSFTLRVKSILVIVYLAQGRLEEAEKLQMEVIETCKRVLIAGDPSILVNKSNLAVIYLKKERRNEAEKLLVEVLEIRKRVLNPEHPATLFSMAKLAGVYGVQGRWDDAERLQVEVVETDKRVLKAHHPDTLTHMVYLAYIYHVQERYGEANALMTNVVDLRIRTIGKDHPDTQDSLCFLEECFDPRAQFHYEKQGR